MQNADRSDIAIFVDFENIALGLRGRAEATFDIKRVLQRLLEKGNIIVKRAYADWSRFASYTKPFHEAGIELIEIPRRGDSGKNSADIRLCVDAMDLCYAKSHVDTFVIVSGDSDFSPLVSKLRENGKRVIGLGLHGSTSNLLVSNCDEFIFYEAIESPTRVQAEGLPKDKEGILKVVTDTVTALLREGRDPIQASLIKDTIKRKNPSFNEEIYGYRSFTDLLDDAKERGLLTLQEDPRSGTYFVKLAKPSNVSHATGQRPPSAPRPQHSAATARPAAAPQPPLAPQPAAQQAAPKAELPSQPAAPTQPLEATKPAEPQPVVPGQPTARGTTPPPRPPRRSPARRRASRPAKRTERK